MLLSRVHNGHVKHRKNDLIWADKSILFYSVLKMSQSALRSEAQIKLHCRVVKSHFHFV